MNHWTDKHACRNSGVDEHKRRSNVVAICMCTCYTTGIYLIHMQNNETKNKFDSKTNNQGVMADLIAFDSNYKAWWVIEVELIGHSFDRHVFPQMEKLIDIDYRDYEEVITDAVSKEYKELDKSKFGELIKRRTPQVITVANKFDSHWSGELRALGVDLIGMQPYQSEGSKNSFFCTGRQLSIDEEKRSQVRWDRFVGAYKVSDKNLFDIDYSQSEPFEVRIYINDNQYDAQITATIDSVYLFIRGLDVPISNDLQKGAHTIIVKGDSINIKII